VILNPRCSAAPPEAGRHLPRQEGAQDEDAPEDLDGDEPVPRQPVAEKGREEGLRGEDDRRPCGRDVLLRRGLRQVGPGRRATL
jgi:hypothetical protein